jgi:hypothetical protein
VPISEAAQSLAITNLTATGLFRQEITEWNRQQAGVTNLAALQDFL